MKIWNLALFLILLAIQARGQSAYRFDQYPDNGAPITADDIIPMWSNAASAVRSVKRGNLLADRQPLNGNLTSLASLTDPNADALFYWKNADKAFRHLRFGTGLSIGPGDVLSAAVGGTTLPAGRIGYGLLDNTVGSEAALYYDPTFNILYAGALSMGGNTIGFASYGLDTISLSTAGSGEKFTFDLSSADTMRFTTDTGVNLVDFGSMAVKVPTEAYDSTGWNGDFTVPTKDAVRDKIEALTISGVAWDYKATWTTATAYAADDVVTYATALYICTSAHTSGALTTPGTGDDWLTVWAQMVPPEQSVTLIEKQIGFGNSLDEVTGEAGFEYDAATNQLDVENAKIGGNLVFEGEDVDANQTTLTAVNPSADRAISLPNSSGVLALANEVGTTKSGTQATPTTTNPLAPTWSTQDYILWYGATGEIDLPAVAGYTNKTLLIYSAGTFTITVDPNGSEIIVETGVSLGAGVADVITGTAGLLVGYTCDGSRWIKLEGGGAGGVASLTPWTENINGGGYNLSNAGTITATYFSGDGSSLTNLPGAEIDGPLPDLTHGVITTARSNVATPTAGVSNVIVTTDAETTITLDATTETLTYSGTPTTGTYFRYTLEGHTSDCTVTIPSTYSFQTGSLRTTFTAPANKPTSVVVRRDGARFVMWGDPVRISDLPADTTPAISAKIEIDQGNGGEFATAANLRDLLGTTFNGTAATPNTDNPETVAFDSLTFYHYSGLTQELDLPAAAGYAGRGIAVRFDGSYVVTCDPNGSEVIDLNGTAMSAGEALIITGTAGQIGLLVSDGTSWATAGGSAAYTQETP